MYKSKILISSLIFVSLSSCCGTQKVADSTVAVTSEPSVVAAQPVTEQPAQVTAEETSKKSLANSPFASGSEYIFSSDAPVAEEKIKAAFSQVGLVSLRSLGGNQYFLKFGQNHDEAELKSILGKNKLSGSLSKNLQYKIPKPINKSQQKNKLKI